MTATQKSLPLFKADGHGPNARRLVEYLQGEDWLTANEILEAWGVAVNDAHRRWLRALAEASDGAVAGGQRGYKLVSSMTQEEYQHFRNWMKSQADQMTSRILKSDKVFYSRQPVAAGNGVL